MPQRRALAFLCVTLIGSVASIAGAREFRVDEIPNGTKFRCRNCHNDDEGATNTPFLADVRSNLSTGGPIQNAHVMWGPALCNVDSDGDGWSNGYELGDPDCVWTVGAAPAKAAISNPGNPDSHPAPVCKNGKLDAGESCDAGQQSKTDCAEESAGQGALGCNFDDCTFDYSDCSLPPGGFDNEDGGSSSEDEGCAMAAGGDVPGAALFVSVLGAALLLSRSSARGGGRCPRGRRPAA